MSDADKAQIVKVIRFVMESPQMFPGEFGARVGIPLANVEGILLDLFPSSDVSSASLPNRLINNCLNEVCNGLRISALEFETSFSATRDDLYALFDRFRKLDAENDLDDQPEKVLREYVKRVH